MSNILTHLNCNTNQLSSLPNLPNTLTYLNCADNQTLRKFQLLCNYFIKNQLLIT